MHSSSTTYSRTVTQTQNLDTDDELGASLIRFGGDMDGNHEMRAKMEKMLREAQISITNAIEEIDGQATFHEDSWSRATGGDGEDSTRHRTQVTPASATR